MSSNWFGMGALPLGFILFLGMAFAYFKRRADHAGARHAYPDLARQLGLEYQPSSLDGVIGRLRGRIDGFAVVVDPDDQRKLIVRFRGEPEIDLRTYDVGRRSARLRLYASGDRRFDRFFKTRYASEAIAERLDAVDVSGLLDPFFGSYYRAIKQVNLTSHGVTCVLDFGNPPHIPASAVAELLPALVRWARVIEPPDEETSPPGPAVG